MYRNIKTLMAMIGLVIFTSVDSYGMLSAAHKLKSSGSLVRLVRCYSSDSNSFRSLKESLRDTFPSKSVDNREHLYGVTTTDSLFKWVLDTEIVRKSFIRNFIPGLEVVESERIDEHMNPVKDYDVIQNLLNSAESDIARKTILENNDFRVLFNRDVDSKSHDKTVSFVRHLFDRFDDLRSCLPHPLYAGTMDFACRLSDGQHVLIEMQLVPSKYWEKRSLAYAASVYSNQLKRGMDWKDLEKVISVNVLGGGIKEHHFWKDSPGEFVRHYRIQEQNYLPSRYIDEIEIYMYSLMNAPSNISDGGLRDWLLFFLEAPHMTEADVREQIHDEGVLAAFDLVKKSSLPSSVDHFYQKELQMYKNLDENFVEERKKGRKEGEKEGRKEEKFEIAKEMLSLGIEKKLILKSTGLSEEELDSLSKTD